MLDLESTLLYNDKIYQFRETPSYVDIEDILDIEKKLAYNIKLQKRRNWVSRGRTSRRR